MMTTRRSMFLLLLLLGPLANAQPPQLPNSLSGRWSWVERGLGQSFTLEDIKSQPDELFTAKLTWWTIDPKCAIRDFPLVGKRTETGFSFDAKTRCDIAFTAELAPASSGWEGKATTTNGTAIVLTLKAK